MAHVWPLARDCFIRVLPSLRHSHIVGDPNTLPCESLCSVVLVDIDPSMFRKHWPIKIFREYITGVLC